MKHPKVVLFPRFFIKANKFREIVRIIEDLPGVFINRNDFTLETNAEIVYYRVFRDDDGLRGMQFDEITCDDTIYTHLTLEERERIKEIEFFCTKW